MREHWFWFSVLVLVLGWYSIITVYVTVRGLADIKAMLRRLKNLGS